MTVRSCPKCSSTSLSQVPHWDDQHDESFLVYTCQSCGNEFEDEGLDGVLATAAMAAAGGGAALATLFLAPALFAGGAIVAAGGYFLREKLRD